MKKRNTRVQAVVIQNGKYILIKHLSKDDSRYFWALPGGGVEEFENEEQAVIREIQEETGLTIKLLPIKYEENCIDSNSLYKKKVTFIAYPISGTAKLGYDPEPDDELEYTMSDICWHDFYNDGGIDQKTRNSIIPTRKKFEDYPFIKRCGSLVYKIEDNNIYYLFVSKGPGLKEYILPQGHNEFGESMEETAIRETLEEAGVILKIEKNLGFFLHKRNDKDYLTQMYLGKFVKQIEPTEPLEVRWFTYEQVKSLKLYQETIRFIDEVQAYLINLL